MLLERQGAHVKCATLLSGGMDSAVMLYDMHPTPQVAVSVDYGQSHAKEIGYAARLCANLGVEHVVLQVNGMQGSSLLGSGGNKCGADTVVPYRNGTLIHLAANVAVQHRCTRIAIGCNKTDSEIYKDCRKYYLEQVGKSIASLYGLRLCWPLLGLTKTDIRETGELMGVPFDHTWSCYSGEGEPCGSCGACIEVEKTLCNS